MFPNIRAEMARNRFTNKDVAKILGICTNSVNFKLNGRYQFTLTEISTLADVFDCSLDYLVGHIAKNKIE
jgi:hypothetical protein